ncbi:hypothetical protein [Alicyclobacillus fodiniaquatilis]|uniref:Uncharacterized protein n=1 Tax=Alicyclobacillus fodiniaquatilis TaxID=1661150 RepID=A0ABW4JQ20_9BACL
MDAELKAFLTRFERKLDNLEGKFNNFEDKVDNLEGSVEKLQGKVDKLESKVDNLEGKVDNLEGKLDETKDICEALRHGQEILNAKVISIEKATEYFAERIGAHDKDLYVLKNVK